MFGRRRQPTEVVELIPYPETTEEKLEWTEIEAWLFRTVSGVYHTDPASGTDSVFDMFFIETDESGSGIIVTPETAAAEMAKLRDAFSQDYPHIFEAALPKEI